MPLPKQIKIGTKVMLANVEKAREFLKIYRENDFTPSYGKVLRITAGEGYQYPPETVEGVRLYRVQGGNVIDTLAGKSFDIKGLLIPHTGLVISTPDAKPRKGTKIKFFSYFGGHFFEGKVVGKEIEDDEITYYVSTKNASGEDTEVGVFLNDDGFFELCDG